jgi:hypothetical protein
MARHDWIAVQREIRCVRVLIVVILGLGFVASVVSAVGRYI